MDPLVPINESLSKNEIPKDIYNKVLDSVKKVHDAITQIEKASNIKYPEWYVYPKAIVMKAPVGESSIIYSRFFPFSYENVLYTLVQVTPPLILYAPFLKLYQGHQPIIITAKDAVIRELYI